jgi:predicted nucleic acid-binding protein
LLAIWPERREVLKAAFAYGATVHDAVFIALAAAHEVTLLTAERTTTGWVTRLGKRAEIVR